MNSKKSEENFHAGQKVSHSKLGTGFIRILKPFEKSFVEFLSLSDKEDKNSRCAWVENSELAKAN